MENYRAARKTVSTAYILGPLYLVTGFWRARWRSRGSDMMTLGAILGFGALGAEAFNRRSRATQTGENHMTKRKTAPATERAGASAFDIDGLLAMNQRIYQNMMRVHTELLDFTSRRLRADIEVAQKLTGGGKLDDAVEAVYGFQRQMISDYADEASELVKMSTSMAGYLIQEVEDDVKEVVGARERVGG